MTKDETLDILYELKSTFALVASYKEKMEENDLSITNYKEFQPIIIENEEEYINSYITQLFNKYKEKGIDIFNVYRMKEIYYGKESIDDPLSICDFEINTKVNINGTGLSKNAL